MKGLWLLCAALAAAQGGWLKQETSATQQEESPASVQAPASQSRGPCDLRFESMSRGAGLPGAIFEMVGWWGPPSGNKTPSINKGRQNHLEVLSWSERKLVVRVPAGLGPGVYRVGVYCLLNGVNYGSGWKDFEVLGGAPGESGSAESALEPARTQSEAFPSGPADESGSKQAQAVSAPTISVSNSPRLKRAESAAKKALGRLRAAMARYRADRGGNPDSLVTLVKEKYLDYIPSLDLPKHGPVSLVTLYPDYNESASPKDTGGWGYDPDDGFIFIDCWHPAAVAGRPFSSW